MASTRQLAAIMFTDIVGYTTLMGRDEQRALDLLKINREVQKPLIEAHHGKWHKEIGDGMLATFPTVSDAVYCAAAIQSECKKVDDLTLRIGIHQGEITFEEGDVFGDGVNIASRIECITPAGSIWVSESVSRNIHNKPGIKSTFIRSEQLKNVQEPIQIYEVVVDENVFTGTLIGKPDSSAHNLVTKKRGRLALYFSLAAVAILCVVYILYPGRGQSEVDTQKSIAVLAFDDQSPNGDQQWLGDGIADEILNVLAQAKGLKVSGKTSSFSFKGKNATIGEIGSTLDVKTILEGSVTKVGGKIRITAQLINVEDQAHLWSHKYDHEANDIFAIVDSVAQSIVRSLMSELSNEQVSTIKMSYQPNPEAYQYIIRANELHDEYLADDARAPELFERSKELYSRALLIDPSYMDAMAGLADLYDSKGNREPEAYVIRDSILAVAYRKDPNSPYTLYLKGGRIEKNPDSAFYFLKKAYSLDPNNLGTSLLMQKYTNLGLYEDSRAIATKIVAKDPLNDYVHRWLIRTLWATGQIEEAKVQIVKYQNFHGDSWDVISTLFRVELFFERDTVEAKALISRLVNINPRSKNYHEALLLAYQGKKEEALAKSTSMHVYGILGIKEEVLKSLRVGIDRNAKAIGEYTGGYSYIALKNNPVLDSVRNEPQFQKWLEEAKIVYEERKRKYGNIINE